MLSIKKYLRFSHNHVDDYTLVCNEDAEDENDDGGSNDDDAEKTTFK